MNGAISASWRATWLVLPLLLADAAHAGNAACNPRLLIANRNPETNSGSLASMCAADPWQVQTELATLQASDYTLRVSGDAAYVVHRDTGRIASFDLTTFAPISEYELGADAQPHDIAVIDAKRTYVTRHGATHLLRLDLDTGETTEVADLSIFASGDVPHMSMMAIDDNHLFIQIQQSDVLAVFDVATDTLLDVDPEKPGVQPIHLQGTLPRYKMQINPALRRLYLSATGGMWSTSGGIEIIDLDTLTSTGFVLDNPDGYDVGAFIMASDTRGYYVFHTDFAPSSHLQAFDNNAPDGSKLLVHLGTPQTHSLAFEPLADHVYFYNGAYQEPVPQPRGVYVLDAQTGNVLSDMPIDVGGWPNDIAVVQQCPADINADGAVNVSDLLSMLSRWGPAAPFEPADLNHDGAVNVADLLLLLGGWGPCR